MVAVARAALGDDRCICAPTRRSESTHQGRVVIVVVAAAVDAQAQRSVVVAAARGAPLLACRGRHQPASPGAGTALMLACIASTPAPWSPPSSPPALGTGAREGCCCRWGSRGWLDFCEAVGTASGRKSALRRPPKSPACKEAICLCVILPSAECVLRSQSAVSVLSTRTVLPATTPSTTRGLLQCVCAVVR